MSPALPPTAPARPPNNPQSPPPPPAAGAFFMRSDSPGTPPSSCSNSAPPSLSLAALNSTPAPPSACEAFTPRPLVSISMSSCMCVLPSIVGRGGEAIGSLAPGHPNQRDLANGDIGFARRHLDRAQRHRAGIQRAFELRDFGFHLSLHVGKPLLQHFDAFFGACHVLGLMAPARCRARGGTRASD